MGERHGDTRSRIQEVALELFTEHGYEATSLREIAERLGVTKAALYYHFKTKEDIVASFMEDRVAALEEIVAWGRDQPKTDETRREVLHRYSDLLAKTGHHKVMRFLERNQTALRGHPKSERIRDVMISVIDLLSDRGDPLPVRLKSSLALFAMHATWFIDPDHTAYTDEERAKSALQIALELLDSARADKSSPIR
jgi:AcrR family transcriptional regulator